MCQSAGFEGDNDLTNGQKLGVGAVTMGPRNQLGEPATRTPDETVARLKEKVSKNHGGANRERIETQIAKELAAEG